MSGKRPPKKAPAKAGADSGGKSVLTALEVLDKNTKGVDRRILFEAVAERVRSCILDPAEAALIAGWFDKLAGGADAKKVLYGETRGRPRGSTGVTFVKGEYVRLPDHADLCWMMRRAMTQHSPESVYSHVATLYGVTAEYVESVWEETSPTLADDPDLPTK